MNNPTTAPDQPTACPTCLRRAWLLAELSPYLERFAAASADGSVATLLDLDDERLVEALIPSGGTEILERVAALSEGRLRSDLREAECWACCFHDELYPASLREVAGQPRTLIGRGDPRLLVDLSQADSAVALVGSRRASSYGREVARRLGRDLATAGLTVVSGMAFGIDACAHRGALETGRTVAVLGCGPDVSYPATHRALWRRIQEAGLVLSELPPGTGAWRWAFPARSRIIAALAGTTVVVEAAERSGALTTAELAADLGREQGALPGPVTSRTSAGTNALLAGGAYVVREAQDVLDSMLEPGARTGKAEASMELRCPDCVSLEVALIDRGTVLECGNCGSTFSREEAFVSVADADSYAEEAASCTCSKGRGCPKCFAHADELVGVRVRDRNGREWQVQDVDEKDGFPTVGGEGCWDYVDQVELLRPPPDESSPLGDPTPKGGS